MAAPTKSSRKSLPPPEKMTYEAAVEELEQILEQVEQGEIGLEESLEARRRGEALIKRCRSILDTAMQELKEIKPESDGADQTVSE